MQLGLRKGEMKDSHTHENVCGKSEVCVEKEYCSFKTVFSHHLPRVGWTFPCSLYIQIRVILNTKALKT